MDFTWYMTCGGCGTQIWLTERDWQVGGIAPCPTLGCDAGADIDHTKRNAG
jgi:hypothetical protein